MRKKQYLTVVLMLFFAFTMNACKKTAYIRASTPGFGFTDANNTANDESKPDPFIDAINKGKYNTAIKYPAAELRGIRPENGMKMIEDGVDVNRIYKNFELNGFYQYYSTALIVAAGGNHKNIVELLLKNGADINLTVPYIGSALTEAANKNNFAIAKYLVETGADIRHCVEIT
jgi:ankyrin repeat protein